MNTNTLNSLLSLSLLFSGAASIAADLVTTHPRLWLTASDLPRLLSWATPANPVYGADDGSGLASLAQSAKLAMDVIDPRLTPPAPDVPYADDGLRNYEQYPTEMYAEFFAFMSLISTNATAQLDYARRATNLLMHAMNQAVLGPDTNDPPAPFRDPNFYTYDNNRSRWYGEGWPLTVDWIYPYLSASDKTTIRRVFLRWANEILTNSYPRSPSPMGVTNDPALLAEGTRYGAPFNPARWAGNNHFTSNMRNLGLMAMAFDPADDPGNQLHNYLQPATGAFLYTVDYLLRHDCRGGLLPEGFEYSPQTASYIVQFLYALHTAGEDNPVLWGPQVVLANQPFWGDLIHAYLNSLSPGTAYDPGNDVTFHYAAWYGDGQQIGATDFINCFGLLGIFAYNTGDTNRLNATRWIEQHLPPGGPEAFINRAGADNNSFSGNIFYFMLYDPAAIAPLDPRPAEPLDFFVPGIGRILSRTGWDTNATWFTYILSWSHVDHQLEDGNQFEWFRRGEWLTSERTGYDLDFGSSDNHNTLALENDPPDHNEPSDFRHLLYLRGSQWGSLSGGDPQIVSYSLHHDFVIVTGDATALYNSTYENSTNILHASRSLVWLKPDHLIVYDRAASQTARRFKRFWLNTATNAVITGTQAAVTMPSGQKLFSTTLLPTNAIITSEPYTNLAGDLAPLESMLYRLRVEAPDGPATARFLHVLQGAEPNTVADSTTLVQSTKGTPFAGTVVASTAVLFPVDLGASFAGTTYGVPAPVGTHLITGLAPNAGYTAVRAAAGTGETVTISVGGPSLTDSGGVLVIRSGIVLSLSLATATNVLLSVDGAAGRPVSIQSSSNLTSWTILGQATNGNNGQLKFGDRILPGQPERFYRAVVN